jgi:hypothetical protein
MGCIKTSQVGLRTLTVHYYILFEGIIEAYQAQCILTRITPLLWKKF